MRDRESDKHRKRKAPQIFWLQIRSKSAGDELWETSNLFSSVAQRRIIVRLRYVAAGLLDGAAEFTLVIQYVGGAMMANEFNANDLGSEIAKTKSKAHGIIATMGLYWRTDDVFWGRPKNPGSLLGRPANRLKSDPVDFRDQVGLYVLYADYRIVYVGQTGSGGQKLFVRMRQHRNDHLAGRWNQFSWFGVLRVLGDKKLSVEKNALHPSLGSALNHIEGVLIQAAEPPQNRQSGRFGETVQQYLQARDPRLGPTERELLERLCQNSGTSTGSDSEESCRVWAH